MGGEAGSQTLKYVVSSTRKDFPGSTVISSSGICGQKFQRLKDAIPEGVLSGQWKACDELDRLDLIDEYKLLIHPRIVGHGPTLYQDGPPKYAKARADLRQATSQRRGRGALSTGAN